MWDLENYRIVKIINYNCDTLYDFILVNKKISIKDFQAEIDKIEQKHKEELWFLMKCYNDYVQDFINNRDLEWELPICLGEFYNNEYQDFYQYYLDLLWNDLAYVGVAEVLVTNILINS